ncbi:MAG: 2-hydroxyacyl-CoA dehydratase [Deltaproteobacteria bacterium]|nr:2-hydroxyacyl-CoA dehydratase [Deltaproteobacteria bacterium]
MSDPNSKGLSKVATYYENYGMRAGELSKEGRKVIGYICSFVPLEILTAAGCAPFRMRGDVNEPITKGDNLMETIVCPFIRSCFDLSIKGRYDFLSGMVIPHACDSMTRSYSTWEYSLDYPFSHFINMPSVVKDASFEFFEAELNVFRESLEGFVGRKITDDDMKEAIRLHNENRDKARALYTFRKADPPMISGSELSMSLTVASSLPVEEANALFDDIITEIKARTTSPLKKGPRIMIDGACVDNVELVRIIEDLGGNVVVDTLCNGTRDYWPRVEMNGDPIRAIARRYLDKVNCPKTYRENVTGTFEDDMAHRFGDVGFFAGDFKVDGAILYVYRFCDPFGFEVPARKAYYESIDIPFLYLEDEYSAGTIGQLKTRIQAFLEMIESI